MFLSRSPHRNREVGWVNPNLPRPFMYAYIYGITTKTYACTSGLAPFLLPLPANLEVKSGDISSQIHPSALCSSQGVHTGNRPPTTRPPLAKSRDGGAESEPNAVCEEQRVEIAAGPIVARLRPGRCELCAGGSSVLLGATFRKGCHCERH